jgi:hypothetical protein
LAKRPDKVRIRDSGLCRVWRVELVFVQTADFGPAKLKPATSTIEIEMRILPAILAVLASSLGASGTPAATYQYTGTPFTEAALPYQLGQRVTGTLELTQPLPPNMAATDIPIANFVDLLFVDGVQVRSAANSVICRLVLGTDAAGNINAWMIWVRADAVGVGYSRYSLETYNIPGFSADLVGVGVYPGACDSGELDPRASTLDAGSWRADGVFGDGFEG